jgi:hypothetical protein
VLDIGSSLVKAGYAGDDGPKGVFPSVRMTMGDAIDANCYDGGENHHMKSCPSFPVSFTHCNTAPLQHVGITQATSEANGMEVDGQQAAAAKRKQHIGQMGVNYWRENMEVSGPGMGRAASGSQLYKHQHRTAVACTSEEQITQSLFEMAAGSVAILNHR